MRKEAGMALDNLHFPKINRFLLARCCIDFHDSERRTNTQGAVKNIYAEDDGVTLTECCDDFKTTRPDCLWSSVLSLGLCNLFVIGLKRVEKMVNDIRYFWGKNRGKLYKLATYP